MKAVAIKKGQGQENAAGFREMGTLRCDGCGEEFVIGHPTVRTSKSTAVLSATPHRPLGLRRDSTSCQ
jgi:hypothetical protein